jgi:hypothetical protein
LESNSFFRHLKKDVGENFSKYSIFLGVMGIDDIVKVLLGAGGMSTIEGVFKSYNECKKVNADIKNSSIYFYRELMDK